MKTIKSIIASLSFALVTIFGASSCSLLKNLEKSCDVTFVGGEPFTTAHVTTFNNGLTPHIDKAIIPENHKFFGWTALNPETIHYTDRDFKDKYVEPDGIVRYDDIKNQIVNGKVTMKPLFINYDDIPSYYLVVGWYAKTGTSGLNTTRINNWKSDLFNFLRTSRGATDEQIANVVIRPYDGNVATIGALINADGDVDVFLGGGANLKSDGGVEYVERQKDIIMGGISRYIYRISERSIGKYVYDWSLTDAGHAALA